MIETNLPKPNVFTRLKVKLFGSPNVKEEYADTTSALAEQVKAVENVAPAKTIPLDASDPKTLVPKQIPAIELKIADVPTSVTDAAKNVKPKAKPRTATLKNSEKKTRSAVSQKDKPKT